MLAGVGAVDACLFVVAATEGWKPQSEEHLRILELLGVGDGVVALTKVDLVDDDVARAGTARRRRPRRRDVPRTGADRAGRPRRPATGSTSCASRSTRSCRRPRRRPIAAGHGCGSTVSFAAKGSGTVVTGTLTGGRLATDDAVVVEPARCLPRIRVDPDTRPHRSTRSARATAWRSTSAVSTTTTLGRGDVVVTPGRWRLDRPVRRRARRARRPRPRRVAPRRLSSPTSGRASCRSGCASSVTEALAPGDSGAVRLHLPVSLPLLPGDRFVLRESGRDETVGGGVGPRRRTGAAGVEGASRPLGRPGRRRAGLGRRRRARAADRRDRRIRSVGHWVATPAALAATRSRRRRRDRRRRVSSASTWPRSTTVERAVVEHAGRRRRSTAGRARPAGAADPLADHPLLAVAPRRWLQRRRRPTASTEVRSASWRGAACSSSATGCGSTPRRIDAAAHVAASLLQRQSRAGSRWPSSATHRHEPQVRASAASPSSTRAASPGVVATCGSPARASRRPDGHVESGGGGAGDAVRRRSARPRCRDVRRSGVRGRGTPPAPDRCGRRPWPRARRAKRSSFFSGRSGGSEGGGELTTTRCVVLPIGSGGVRRTIALRHSAARLGVVPGPPQGV